MEPIRPFAAARNPVEMALATLGHLVRRGRASSLTPGDLATLVALLNHDLADCGADEDGLLRARLKMLWRAGRDETLTFDQFEAITSSIRRSLQKARDALNPDPSVPDAAGPGRRYGGLTVFDGGRCNTPDPTKGACNG